MSAKLASDFSKYIELLLREKDTVYLALSGGRTPVDFFRELVKNPPGFDWERIRIFWVDERCVLPEHPESNFGVAKRELLDPLNVPPGSYFRIMGEFDPVKEARRYSDLIIDKVSPELSFPVFDLIFLGMGDDGHTASVFPDQIDLWKKERLCTVATHPVSKQRRITFTGHLINAANKVIFTVAGESKAMIAATVIRRTENYTEYPASLVDPWRGQLEWYLDHGAASFLK